MSPLTRGCGCRVCMPAKDAVYFQSLVLDRSCDCRGIHRVSLKMIGESATAGDTHYQVCVLAGNLSLQGIHNGSL